MKKNWDIVFIVICLFLLDINHPGMPGQLWNSPQLIIVTPGNGRCAGLFHTLFIKAKLICYVDIPGKKFFA